MAFGLNRKKEPVVDNTMPTEEEIKLCQDIALKFDNAKNAKAPKVAIWKQCIEAYNSEYFKSLNKPDYKSDAISNFIFATIETIKPIMTDNDPKVLALPKTPKGVEKVEKIQNIFDSEWQRAKMGIKLPQAISIALQIGTAIIHMPWDGKDENGLGNVNPTLINPFNFFPDPMATTIDDSEFDIYANYININKLKQKYPKHAEKLSAGQINYPELAPSGSKQGNVTNQVLVLACYMRDYSMMEYEADEEYEEDGEKKTKKVMKQGRKYPKGRVITCCPELNVILEDKPNPYEDGEFPFRIIKCYDVPFEFWGKGEIEQLLSPQTYVNDLMNQIIDNAKLTTNMPWVIDKNSGIGQGQLTNRPGLIVRKNPGTEVKRLQPPSMPNYVAEMVETLKRDMEIISGIHDVTQGRKPGSVSAASAIIALQEAAQARIRLKVKLMEQSLGDLGHMWFSRIKQFWLTERYVRFMTDEGTYGLMPVNPDEDLDVDIDFMIMAGSTMPTNKPAMLDLMIRLAQTPAEDQLPMVDRETVLTYANVPDKRKILDRFNQKSQAAQQAQAQAAQAQQQTAEDQMLAQMEQQMATEKMKIDGKQQMEMVKMQGQKVQQSNQIKHKKKCKNLVTK